MYSKLTDSQVKVRDLITSIVNDYVSEHQIQDIVKARAEFIRIEASNYMELAVLVEKLKYDGEIDSYIIANDGTEDIKFIQNRIDFICKDILIKTEEYYRKVA